MLLRVGGDLVDDLGGLGYGLDGRTGGDDALGVSHVGIGILVDDVAFLVIDGYLDNVKVVPVVGELLESQLVGNGLFVATVMGIKSTGLGQVK